MRTIKDISLDLRDVILAAGHTKAAYFLSEEAATAVGQPRAGHYSRRNAAKAIQLGFDVTLDLGYNGCLQFDGSLTVSPGDLGCDR